MPDTFVVDTYQVNVGAGDCSVHILAKNPGATDDVRGEVIHAVLMDGGEITNSQHYISQTLTDIGARYTNTSTIVGVPLQFHSLVITHWDRDHWRGMIDLLQRDLASQYTVAADAVFELYDAWKQDKESKPEDMPPKPVDLKKIQSNYLKYGRNGELQTTLYCPVWESSQSQNFVPGAERGKEPETPEDEKYNGAPQGKPHWDVQLEYRTNTVSINAGSFPAGPSRMSARRDMYVPACRVVYDAINLIGREIFTSKIFAGDNADRASPWASVKTLSSLLKAHGAVPGQPGMYCVAAARQVIGRPNTAIDKFDNASPDASIKFDNSENNKTNAMSLAFIIAWPPIKIGAKPRVSLYTGGDAEGYVETRLLPFLEEVNTVSVLKAGHHGSEMTLQPIFIKRMNPGKIVFSSGKTNKHPHWTRLALLALHYNQQIYKQQRGPEAFFWSTCYPYWTIIPPKNPNAEDPEMAQIEAMSDRFNPSAFYNKPFRDVLTSWYQEYRTLLGDEPVPAASPDILAEYDQIMIKHGYEKGAIFENGRVIKRKALQELLPFFMRLFGTLWQAMSDVTFTDLADNAVDASGNYLDGSSRLSQLWIKHRDDISDGTILIFRLGVWLSPRRTTRVYRDKRENSVDEIEWHPRGQSRAGRLYNPSKVPMEENHVVESKSSNTSHKRQKTEAEVEEEKMEGEDNLEEAPSGATGGARTGMLFVPMRVNATPMVGASAFDASTATTTSTVSFLAASHYRSTNGTLLLSTDDPLDEFLAALAPSFVGLDKDLTVSPGQTPTVTLSKTTGFSRWLSESIGATAIHLSLLITSHRSDSTGSRNDANIVHWTVSLNLAKNDQSNGAIALTFSSMASHLAKTLNFTPDTASGTIGDTGYSVGLGALVLALEQQPSASIGLGHLCTFLDLPLGWMVSALDKVTLRVTQDADASQTAVLRRLASNAIWIRPDQNYSTIIRLHLREVGGSRVEPWIMEHLPDIQISDIRVIAYKDARRLFAQSDSSHVYKVESSITYTAKIGLGNSSAQDFSASIRCGTTGLDVSLRWDGTADPIVDMLTWVNKRTQGMVDSSVLDSFVNDLVSKNPLKLRQFSLQIGQDKSLQQLRFEFEIHLDLGAPKNSQVPLLVSFTWSPLQTSFRAEIWPHDMLPKYLFPIRQVPADYPAPWIWPTYDPLRVRAPTCATPIDHFSLKYLRPRHGNESSDSETIDSQQIPAWLPTEIYDAVLEISDKHTIMSAQVFCDEPGSADAVPAIALESLNLFAEFRRAQGPDPAGFNLHLEGRVTLHARESVTTPSYSYGPASLSVRLDHAAKTTTAPENWTLSASADDLALAALYSLFPKGGQQDAVMNILEHLYIPHMSIIYQYNKGVASSLMLSGSILVGDVELDLEYRHDSKGWIFEAVLGEAKKALILGKSTTAPTLGSILGDISPEIAQYLPDLVTNIPIELKQDLHVGLVCKSGKGTTVGAVEDPGSLVMGFVVEMDSLQVTVATIQQYSTNPDKAQASTETQMMSTKRVVKLTLDEFHFKDVGMLGQLTQPFEAIDLVWSSADMSQADVELLNKDILQDTKLFPRKKEPLRHKSTASAEGQGLSNAPVITAGCHLMVTAIRAGAVVVLLDYPFGSTNVPTPQLPAPVNGSTAAPPVKTPTLEGGGEEVSTSVSEQRDALTITTLGLALADRVLSITLTAKLAFGPLALGLIDFVLHVDYTQARHLRDISNLHLSASIGGIEVEYKKAPVILAGLFRHIVKNDMDLYTGGINLGITPYNFLAAGMYGDAKGPPPARKQFKTMFVFAKLNGPLIELEFAEINGICGGFGYNSNLRFPEISQLGQFPLLTTSDNSAKDPLEELNALTDSSQGWIQPQDGALWLAAGLEIKAFQVVDISALVAINLGESVTLGVFAEAVAKLPKGVPDEQILLFVDFLFTAQINFTKGTLIVGGELAPRSFILHPSCHLTGGMALAYWFPNSGHPGDWVFTIGGYHPQYKKPSHYPDASRLGISWRYDDHLYISGGAYFALTPRLCMAGIRLQAHFEMDSLTAYLEAHADFLVNFEPFQFQGDIGVSVHVSYDIDYLFGHDTITGDISANVKIHGPPVGGTVYIDLHIFDVSVEFGKAYQPQPARSLDQFWSTICQGKDEDKEHIFSVESGLVSQPQNFPGGNAAATSNPWVVRGDLFHFHITFRGAASSIQYGTQSAVQGQPVHAKLCKQTGNNLPSSGNVSICRKDSPDILNFTMEVEKKQLPVALWGEYSFESDPDLPLPGRQAALTKDEPSTIEHIMGVALRPPKASPSDDRIPPLNLADASKVDLLTDKNNPPQIPISQLDPALPLPFDTAEEARLAWNNPNLRISKDNLVGMFASLVENTGGGREAAEFRSISTSPPRELFKEWKDLIANAPDTKINIDLADDGVELESPMVPDLEVDMARTADPKLWYSGLPWGA